MKKLRCADCGCALEAWDMVYDWPGVGEVCENCMESRVYEMRAAEAAERMGVTGRRVEEV